MGRQFVHGVLDFWSLVRDYYARELGIALEDAFRPDGWWNDGQSDLYTAGLEQRGGIVLPEHAELQTGDVILMQIRSTNGVPNHAAVYLGDTHILHHLYGRLSSRDVYGGYWRQATRFVARHARLSTPFDPREPTPRDFQSDRTIFDRKQVYFCSFS
ncbi:NlpC/P60 family protein [Pararobbsia silviterrae]|uniref:NlpC/P60 family protein n=1 Tax=Pararobbsia silviterrae TaxID=1792498 RepID=UPI001F0C916D|nr:NlpC/P60 family protein [Pararobbsia silviterrae]